MDSQRGIFNKFTYFSATTIIFSIIILFLATKAIAKAAQQPFDYYTHSKRYQTTILDFSCQVVLVIIMGAEVILPIIVVKILIMPYSCSFDAVYIIV